MEQFVKVSELSGKDRTKLRKYWGELWGSEFAGALTTDFKPDGKAIDVEASSKETKA